MLADRTTLHQFLVKECRRHPAACRDLHSLIGDVAASCKLLAGRLARGIPAAALGAFDTQDDRSKSQAPLFAFANDSVMHSNEPARCLAGLAAGDVEALIATPSAYQRGQYLLVFDSLEGQRNIDINGALGSIFAILRAPHPGTDAAAADLLQPGGQQVCAGYALYGPATVLVVTIGTGVHGFTLDHGLGDFILTHPAMRIATAGSEFAVDASSSKYWESAVKRYVAECLAGQAGPRRKEFKVRSVESLVAETHRVLARGGVFLHPSETRDPPPPSQLQLISKANPIAFLVEQAGGAASTGRGRILDLVPSALHQRVPMFFGAREEIELIESYHRELYDENFDAPLFGSRGLFRATA